MELSEEQSNAVNHIGSAYVTACPGSGKTRALTAKLALGMSRISVRSEKVLAVAYTNRAANEIKSRIESNEHYDSSKLWAGTIHSFALEWIIRPYAAYWEQLNNGYVIADEYETRKIIAQLKKDNGMKFFDDVNTSYDRSGYVHNASELACNVEREYRNILAQRKKIDFDQALYYAYAILELNPEVSETLGAVFRLICVDEVQDTQDLQYAILSKIHNASRLKPDLFIVGDENQAIYESIGGLSKTLSELNQEFEHSNLVHFSFSDNYRSTQRLADYFSYFRNTSGIISKADHFSEPGRIVFSNQEIEKENLPEYIANIVQAEIDNGIPENEICIIAPQWSPIRSLSKRLINLLPDVRFDAPSLSPFYGQQDNFWLTVAKLALTIPSGRMYSVRIRWANEVITSLNEYIYLTIDIKAKKLLKIINSFKSDTLIGTEYLHECFEYFMSELGVELEDDSELSESHELFFEKSEKNMEIAQCVVVK